MDYGEVRIDIEDSDIDAYVFGFAKYFADDVVVECSDCGTDGFARPYYPKNKTLLCLNCAADKFENSDEEGEGE